ncbi:MAG: hypothetical protein LBE83_00205 [Propionibacteriaceae bacterium]|jgi:hypothetical protein|nr:hypothetical protein [Propionibacteriaceae bacterium]
MATFPKNPDARLSEILSSLEQAQDRLINNLREQPEETGQPIDTITNPPVTIHCGLDGIVQSVRFDEFAYTEWTGRRRAVEIQEAIAHQQFTAPQSLAALDQNAAVELAARVFLAEIATWKADFFSRDTQPEVVGFNDERTVSVTCAGRILIRIRIKESWAARAMSSEIESAVIEASKAAMAMLNTLRERT